MMFSFNVQRLRRGLVWQIIFLFVVIPFSKAMIEILLILIILTWIFKNLVEKKILLFNHPLRVPFLLFLMSCAISLFFSPHLGKSLGELINLIEYVVVSMIATEVFSDENDTYTLFGFVLITSVLMGLDGYYQMVFGRDLFLGRAVGLVGNAWRMSASFIHPNTLGAYLAGTLPVFIAFLYEQRKRHAPKWAILGVMISIVLLFGCLFLSYSRGAWLGAMGGIFLLGLLIDRKLLILIGLLILPLLISTPILERARGMINLEDVTVQTRLGTWKLAWEMFLTHPWFGQGLKSFSMIHKQGYVHNCMLQVLAETGLFGFCTFSFLWIRFFQKTLRGLTRISHQRSSRNDASTLMARHATEGSTGVPEGRYARGSPTEHNAASEALASLQQKADEKSGLNVLTCGIVSGVFALCLHSLVDIHFYSIILATSVWLMVGVALSSVVRKQKEVQEKQA